MSFAKVPFRLVSRQGLSKSDVESVYAELVKVIGGTYYLNGVAQGPANGTIDFRNFCPDAGIPNSAKSAPYSIWPVVMSVGTGGLSVSTAQSWNVPVTAPDPNIFPTNLTVIGISLVCSGFASAVNTGSYTFNKYTPGGSLVQIGTTITWTNLATTTTLLSNQTMSVALQPDETLQWSGSVTGDRPINPIGIVWLKTLHVR
jgi:hypothetical protein